MTIWNLIVVLCFGILYLGLVLVYSQVRKLREELRSGEDAAVPARDGPVEPGFQENEPEPVAGILEEELDALAERIEKRVDVAFDRIREETEEIHRRLNALDYRMDQALASQIKSSLGARDLPREDPEERTRIYDRARMLLARGLAEERVVEETGLSVEEVSLLRRLAAEEVA